MALGVLIMAWTLWMALRPDPAITLAVPEGDKLLHALAFTCLMGWWGNVYAAGARARLGRAGLPGLRRVHRDARNG